MKNMWNLLAFAFIIYSGIALLVFVYQRSLLYFPGGDQQPSNEILAIEKLRLWPSNDMYRGVTAEEEGVNARGTIVVFHGNAGSAYNRAFYIKALTNHQFRVVLGGVKK